MLKPILFLLLAIPYFLNAQGNWKIGGFVSPDVCYRTTELPEYIPDIRSDYTRPGASIGLSTIYPFSEKFELEFGACYSYQRLIRSSIDKKNGVKVHYTKYFLETNYLLIPIKTNITIGDERFGFIGSGGISAGFVLKEKDLRIFYSVDEIEEGRNTYDSNVYPNFIFNVEVGAGIRFSKNQFQFRAIPTARYAVFGKFESNHYKFRPFTAGISCGMYYNL